MFDKFEKIENVNLKDYCTFKIGGNGKVIVFPRNVYELKKICKECEENNLQFFILGNGSNVLFPDYYFDKVILSLKKFDNIKIIRKNVVFVGAGVKLFVLNKFLLENSLQGLEFSFGIPASVGGFVCMNGGAFGDEVANHILRVKVLRDNKIIWLKRKEIDFSYRNSNIDDIILGVEFKLKSEDKKLIAEKQQQYLLKRKETQPYDKFSAGSVFKRQNNLIPAKVIDTFGLKGVKIGDAEISRKHAGFIVNNGNAKAMDVLALIKYIKLKTGINFEDEIIILK